MADIPITGNVTPTATLLGGAAMGFALSGTTTGTASLPGGVSFGRVITGSIDLVPHVIGFIPTTDDFTAGIEVVPKVIGTIKINAAEQSSDPEIRFKVDGVRPSFPVVVTAIDVLEESDVSAGRVPADGHFLLSANFLSPPGHIFTESGGAPNSIGTRIVDPTGATADYYLFRQPRLKEVVWHVRRVVNSPEVLIDEGLLLFTEDVWQKYRSWPERMLDGVLAFDVLDPDRVYGYYARLVGASFYEWTYDNFRLLDFGDPDKVPEQFLPELAYNLGDFKLRSEDDTKLQRAKLRDALPGFKLKALTSGARIRLRNVDYIGTILEVWVNPTAVDNWDDLASAPASIQADAASRGLTNAIQPDSGEKGQDYFVLPHGYTFEDQSPYFLSSRVMVVINNLDGSPIDTSQSDAILDEIKRVVSEELLNDFLSSNADIRFFATADPVASETVGVSDTLILTEV